MESYVSETHEIFGLEEGQGLLTEVQSLGVEDDTTRETGFDDYSRTDYDN